MNLTRFKNLFRLDSVRFRYAVLLLFGLIMADGLITEFSVNSGLAWESNPFLRGLIPDGKMMLVKLAGSVLVILLLINVRKQQPRMAEIASWLFVLVYTGIVYWNLAGVILGLSFRA